MRPTFSPPPTISLTFASRQVQDGANSRTRSAVEVAIPPRPVQHHQASHPPERALLPSDRRRSRTSRLHEGGLTSLSPFARMLMLGRAAHDDQELARTTRRSFPHLWVVDAHGRRRVLPRRPRRQSQARPVRSGAFSLSIEDLPGLTRCECADPRIWLVHRRLVRPY